MEWERGRVHALEPGWSGESALRSPGGVESPYSGAPVEWESPCSGARVKWGSLHSGAPVEWESPRSGTLVEVSDSAYLLLPGTHP